MRPITTWTVIVATTTGCFAPDPPPGVRCDLATPSCPAGQSCVAIPEGVVCQPPGISACSPDDAFCLSFDATPLPDALANEGAVSTAVVLEAVSQIAEGTGGAALLGAATRMTVPPEPAIVGVTRIDIRFRLDQEVPIGERVGLVDADARSSGFALFLGRVDQGYELRCSIGGPVIIAALDGDPRGRWIAATCQCSAGRAAIVVDAIVAATMPETCAPSQTETGFQIGQNSRLVGDLPPNEPFVGAIDFVRLVGDP